MPESNAKGCGVSVPVASPPRESHGAVGLMVESEFIVVPSSPHIRSGASYRILIADATY